MRNHSKVEFGDPFAQASDMLVAYFTALLMAGAPPSAPKQKWLLEEREKSCVALRERTSGSNGILIESRPFSSDQSLIFLVPRTGEQVGYAEATLSVPDPHPRGPLLVTILEPRGSADRIIRTGATDVQLKQAAVQGNIAIAVQKQGSHSVRVPGLGKVLVALEECSERIAGRMGIARTWTIPPEEQNRFYRIIRNDDYPINMIERDEQGGVAALLRIDETGAISDCKAYQIEGHRDWEKIICRIVKKRARFNPARDASGKAVSSYILTPMIWFVLG